MLLQIYFDNRFTVFDIIKRCLRNKIVESASYFVSFSFITKPNELFD